MTWNNCYRHVIYIHDIYTIIWKRFFFFHIFLKFAPILLYLLRWKSRTNRQSSWKNSGFMEKRHEEQKTFWTDDWRNVRSSLFLTNNENVVDAVIKSRQLILPLSITIQNFTVLEKTFNQIFPNNFLKEAPISSHEAFS